MRLTVVAVGRLKAGPERELAERFRERASKTGHGIGFRSLDIVEIPESRAVRPADRIAEETAALTKAVPADGVRVVLDAGGKPLTSDALAQRIARWRDDSRVALVFIIGGADGLGEPLRKSCDLTLSFGSVTWPHQLVRIMLLEQLYRATTILSGHPYHRA